MSNTFRMILQGFCYRGGSRTASSAPSEGSVFQILVFPCWTQIPDHAAYLGHTTPVPHLHTHTHKSHSHTPLLCKVLSGPGCHSWALLAVCAHFITFLILNCYPVSDCSLPAPTRIVYWTLILAACLDSMPDSRLCFCPVSVALFTGIYSACLIILNKSGKWIQLSLMLHDSFNCKPYLIQYIRHHEHILT